MTQLRAGDGAQNPGHFAGSDASRPESDQLDIVDLWGEDRGSFEFPPRPQTAQGLIDFWRNVDIPESAARAVDQRQRINAHNEGLYQARQAEYAYKAELNGKKPDDVEMQRRRDEAYKRGHKSVPQFPQGYVYPAIRAAMMYRDAKYLPDSERQRVENLPLRFPGGMSNPKTIWTGFRFENLEGEIANSEARSTAALEKMASQLGELQESQRELADRLESYQ